MLAGKWRLQGSDSYPSKQKENDWWEEERFVEACKTFLLWRCKSSCMHVFKGDINNYYCYIPILTFEVSYCRVLHEMEYKHSENWLFWIGETSSTDGLKGEGFISWKWFVQSTMPLTIYIKTFFERTVHTGVVDYNINRSFARDSLGRVELSGNTFRITNISLFK